VDLIRFFDEPTTKAFRWLQEIYFRKAAINLIVPLSPTRAFTKIKTNHQAQFYFSFGTCFLDGK
jgi:hypothetical protein